MQEEQVNKIIKRVTLRAKDFLPEMRHWKPRHNNLGSNRERVKAIGGTASVYLFPQGQWIAKANTSDM